MVACAEPVSPGWESRGAPVPTQFHADFEGSPRRGGRRAVPLAHFRALLVWFFSLLLLLDSCTAVAICFEFGGNFLCRKRRTTLYLFLLLQISLMGIFEAWKLNQPNSCARPDDLVSLIRSILAPFFLLLCWMSDHSQNARKFDMMS